uniref:Zinc finger protein 281 n=1 Tax=Salmo trutta TaxID=8032 RepID=A0A674A3A8_SALTR
MSIIQDKLGNDFLRSNGSMDSNFSPGMIMFSHLPPVTSFTRLAAQSVMQDLPGPHEMILKKERDSPDCSMGGLGGYGGVGDYVHAMDIKQEKMTEHDYRLPLYPGGPGKSTELLEVSMGNHQNLLVHDLSQGNLPSRLGKESSGKRGQRSNGEEGKPRRKRGEPKQSMMLDADGGSLWPNGKLHICEHCGASFRSSYHLRRHVLIHTEKPYRCETSLLNGQDKCPLKDNFFSRTDRLLKHKRTCGEAIKKDLEPGMLDLGCEDIGQGSYGITQGNAGPSGRKRGKSKNSGEGGERKRKKAAGPAEAGGLGGAHIHGAPSGGPSMHHEHHGQAPKMAFKKANRKALDQAGLGQAKQGTMEQGVGMVAMGLMQGSEAKSGPTSSNYDDAMQFLKKRRYLNAANSAASGAGVAGGSTNDYEVNVGHLSSQQSVIQGVVSGVMDGDSPLSLLDSSPTGVDKHDRSGIPDEVLQSLLDHYTQKPDGSHHDVHFDLSDQHVALHPVSADGSDLSHDADSPSPSGDKTVIMHEYSRFLLQALERTSHNTGFPLGPGPPATGPFTSSHQRNPLFSDKHMYTTSPLECGFGQPVASPTLPSSMPKSHFVMLSGSSPQHGFHLNSLEPATHQQLTPSQELTDQMEKQHSSSPSSYQISPSDLGSQKDSQNLASLDPSKGSYTIENFAQAFGSQFKSASRSALSYGADSSGEVDHRIRTPVSEFSGYTSLLADVNEAVSTGSKTPTSQSYR